MSTLSLGNIGLISGILLVASSSVAYIALSIYKTLRGNNVINLLRNAVNNQEDNIQNRNIMIGILVVTIPAYILLWGELGFLTMTLVFGMLGAILGVAYTRINDQRLNYKRMREVRILFRSVAILMKGGTTLQNSLIISRKVVELLRPSIDRSLAFIPDTSKVLQSLKREINSTEGDMLVSLLGQMDTFGAEQFDGILQREVQKLEELNEAAEKVRIAKKPYLLVISRALPVIVILGMFVGTMFIRAKDVLPFFNL